MFDKSKIIEKIRAEQEWANELDVQKIDSSLIPLNKENSLFLLETPGEDCGLLVREEGTELKVYFIPGEDLFSYNDIITMNKVELFRFIDVD